MRRLVNSAAAETRLVRRHALAQTLGLFKIPYMVNRSEYDKLTVAERLQLVEDIWDSIARGTGKVSVPPEVLDEAERRLAEHERDPSSAIPGDQVKAKLHKRGR